MPRALPALLTLFAATGPAVAGDAPQDPRDELLVVARSVMPRVAYSGPAPKDNPVRVEATVFPGRVFHGAIDGLVTRLAGDDELVASASATTAGPAMRMEPGAVGPLGAGPGTQGVATPGARGFAGSIGGSVQRATSGIADRINSAVQRTTGIGGGP